MTTADHARPVTPVRLRPTSGARYLPGTSASALRARPPRARLASNEMAFGPLPGVAEALQAADGITRYPDDSATALRSALAAHVGATDAETAVGNGSVTLLQQIVLTACSPGDEVIVGAPSFQAYSTLAAVADAAVVTVPLDGTSMDLPRMAAAATDRTRVIFVCTPNNPTGGVVTAADFERFLAALPDDLLVVLDEAYREFVTGPDAVDGLTARQGHPNVLVLRTFSKAYGLAGLRVGYAVGHPEVIAAIQAMRVPFAVSAPAMAAALLSLGSQDELNRRVAAVDSERARVGRALQDTVPSLRRSEGNFHWIPTGNATREIAAGLAEAGVLVRGVPGAGLRVTIGTPEENDAFLTEFTALLKRGPGISL